MARVRERARSVWWREISTDHWLVAVGRGAPVTQRWLHWESVEGLSKGGWGPSEQLCLYSPARPAGLGQGMLGISEPGDEAGVRLWSQWQVIVA